MITNNIKNFKNGWFIGDFSPSLFKTKEFEIAVKYYKKGDSEPKHYHKKITEYNLITKGKIKICDKELSEGDIFVFQPNEIADGVILEDAILVVVKIPSDPTDKYSC